MTRGKYANRASIKRDADEVETTIATYQATVRRLTAENKELTEKLSKLDEVHRKEVRLLKAQLNEGISPELTAYQRKVDQLREELAEAKRKNEKIMKSSDRIIGHIMSTLVADGWGRHDAMNWLIGDGEGKTPMVTDIRASSEAAVRIEHARSGNGKLSPTPRYEDREWLQRYRNAASADRSGS